MDYDTELEIFRNAFRNWLILDKYEWSTEGWTGEGHIIEDNPEGEDYFFCYFDMCPNVVYACVYLLRDGTMEAVLYLGSETKTFERGDYDGVKNYINGVLLNHGYR